MRVPLLRSQPATPLSWRDFAWAVGFTLAIARIMGDAWAEIFRLGYANEELSYVLIAPVVMGWIAWGRRERVAECKARGGWVGILGLLAGWAVYWYGYFVDPVLWRVGAVVAAVGAFLAAAGRDVLLRFAPAIAAAVFLIPISPNGRYRLAVPLQNAAAQATQTVCDIIGLPVERSGSMLTVNGVDVAVAEACNGMRMILTLFLVCYAVAFSARVNVFVRWLLLLASPLVAIVANVIRLVPTVWLFGHASVETARTFHDVSGWVMTVLSFLVLMGLLRLMESKASDESRRGAERPGVVSVKR